MFWSSYKPEMRNHHKGLSGWFPGIYCFWSACAPEMRNHQEGFSGWFPGIECVWNTYDNPVEFPNWRELICEEVGHFIETTERFKEKEQIIASQ